MKRILFAQRRIGSVSGADGLAAWILEALKRDYRLNLLTWEPVDFAALNWSFGTELQPSEIEATTVKPWVDRLAKMLPTPAVGLRDLYVFMEARRCAGRFDAVITAANEADLGPRGIQYIHFPEALSKDPVSLSWYHSSAAVRAYEAIAERLTGFSIDRMKSNLTLANSEFTARAIRGVFGIEPVVIYPPATGKFPEVPWDRRKEGFVCIGRISGEKRIELMIEILSAVRLAGPQVHLHVVGNRWDPVYLDSIRRLVQANAPWVHLHENISRPELVELIASHRYGIHAMDEEPFGMAVAELVSAGCITFVPNSGGQVEIVGDDERLIYYSREDAVHKILRALRDPDCQASLRNHIASRRNLFTSERFVSRLQAVCDYLQVSPVRNAPAIRLASSPKSGEEPPECRP
ncbi:MAG: glycosyltransferase family 4 protein [Candidatus Binatus sp.]